MINLDPSETAQFDAQAESWWDKNGPAKPLHDLNPTRLQFVTNHVHLPGLHVLDVGCGGGIFSESLAQRGAIVTGLDASEKMIQIAREHAETLVVDPAHTPMSIEKPNYLCTTAETFAEQHPASFEVITCFELLEHVPDPDSLIKTCARLCKPAGYLFFSTLNRNLKAYALAIIGAERVLKLLPQGTHHYDKLIKPSELDASCRAANLQLIELCGLHYNPFTRRAKLTSDISVNYIVAARR